jgi:hypothetical protein
MKTVKILTSEYIPCLIGGGIFDGGSRRQWPSSGQEGLQTVTVEVGCEVFACIGQLTFETPSILGNDFTETYGINESVNSWLYFSS